MASGDTDHIEVMDSTVSKKSENATGTSISEDDDRDRVSIAEKNVPYDPAVGPLGAISKVHKSDRKIGHRRVGEGGEITYKKIQSSQIMGSIQLGIQHAIGGLASKPERDLLMQDFMTVETTNFPHEGSNHTPAHHYSEFKFKTYAPIAFRYFRDLFGIQPDDFLTYAPIASRYFRDLFGIQPDDFLRRWLFQMLHPYYNNGRRTRDPLMRDFMTVETTNFPHEGSNHTPAHHYSEFKFKTYAPIAFRYFRDLFGIQPDDFLDFMTVETTNFPHEGSNHTPAHHYSEFKFKTYAPIAFRYFRDLFGIQPDDFLMSMCSAPLRELSNPGASGSIFYLTNDDEFIIKTVQHKEGEFLQKLLPGYYLNLDQTVQHKEGEFLQKLLPGYYLNLDQVRNYGICYFTHLDDEFIIKTVQHKEGEFLQKLLPGYYLNLDQVRN
ncbi:unnamed protein product [Plutella xylostella]|uniref:(diamondback moth) hypothetical protein n=1 Tax=Plutella xylostella TaxID=51655 RepID=A0A8S4GBI1_PLUXY|nr:unnamed protein product [Plutella xylostella]